MRCGAVCMGVCIVYFRVGYMRCCVYSGGVIACALCIYVFRVYGYVFSGGVHGSRGGHRCMCFR